MKSKPHAYEGEQVTVTFDLARCIHAGECVRGLPQVFDPGRKPWVLPNEADPDELLRVVDQCPSGALKAFRKDDGEPESAHAENTITVEPDGPLYIRGEVSLRTPGAELNDTRAALCRCGASKNKPFCDGSHAEAGFKDPGSLGTLKAQAPEEPGALEVTSAPNGPLLTSGPVDIYGAGEAEPIRCARAALCRCGASANKPFCDGAHKAANFTAE
jgi:CDGSH-type Zn-finger protein/uncharacterized Fe-S cluster protein YjdI